MHPSATPADLLSADCVVQFTWLEKQFHVSADFPEGRLSVSHLVFSPTPLHLHDGVLYQILKKDFHME